VPREALEVSTGLTTDPGVIPPSLSTCTSLNEGIIEQDRGISHTLLLVVKLKLKQIRVDPRYNTDNSN
jgi:hypothetical protein